MPTAVKQEEEEVTHVMGTNTSPYNHICCFFEFALVPIWRVHFFFSPEDMMAIISKNKMKYEFVRPQHTVPLCVSPYMISQGPEKSTAFLDVVDEWF